MDHRSEGAYARRTATCWRRAAAFYASQVKKAGSEGLRRWFRERADHANQRACEWSRRT
ncbi:hypothetical protein [Granulibacter bethesdensis]|uniref:hypothetical protein n=1 Tax=Granulibacter bethesdensis TaxID=364410 RepID=UPI001C27A2F8|nr:hypothetical protein [Granulibacter bethesdensis]